jgi:hypothetical protein
MEELPVQSASASFLELLTGFAAAAASWLQAHQAEVEAFAVWGGILRVCAETHLYIPPGPFCYEIVEARRQGRSPAELKSLVISMLGPGGSGYETLCTLLRSAPLLAKRRREVDEVLDCLSDGRYYVAICGALPLVEGVLADASGKWKDPKKYQLLDRLESDDLGKEEEDLIILNWPAVEMLSTGIRDVWKPAGPRVGGPLNRNLIAHGTGRELGTLENAVQAVLLVAAAAQVGEPLLASRPSSM